MTGATSGIGRAAALALAQYGYRIIVVGREAARGAGVVDELERIGPGGEFLPIDLLNLANIRRLTHDVTERYRRIDVLLNNAGGTFRAKALTSDGIERTFALNAVAPYALTTALLSPLQAGEGRVVNVITQIPARTRLNIDELTNPPRYNAFAAYSRAKLVLIFLTLEQAARYSETGITPVAVHPGIVTGTRFGNDMPAWLNRLGPIAARLLQRPTSTVDEAGDRLAHAATSALSPGTGGDEQPTGCEPATSTHHGRRHG
ncbi:MAG TPA: SDR family NAD(P)-dependent oxidoreductase [Rubrobacter sp.]|nr:SDR family NAD(P)-dependent oxidoreductase [Rubrobacter sp.]